MYVLKTDAGFLVIDMDSYGYKVHTVVKDEDDATHFNARREARDVLGSIGDYWASQTQIVTTKDAPF